MMYPQRNNWIPQVKLQLYQGLTEKWSHASVKEDATYKELSNQMRRVQAELKRFTKNPTLFCVRRIDTT